MKIVSFHIILKLSLLFLILFGSCSKKKDDPSLLIQKWKFECFHKNTPLSKDCLPGNLSPMFVEFKQDEVFINGQRNICNGTYVASNGTIAVNLTFCTEAGGSTEEVEWEQRFLDVLRSSKEYFIKNEELFIIYANNDKTKRMRFIREK